MYLNNQNKMNGLAMGLILSFILLRIWVKWCSGLSLCLACMMLQVLQRAVLKINKSMHEKTHSAYICYTTGNFLFEIYYVLDSHREIV